MGKQLIIDTSFKDMVVGIIENDKIIYKMQKECFQRQSEIAISEIDLAFKETKTQPKEIDKVIVTIGPGSYTGVRIALTIAKVYCSSLQIELVPLTSLQALAGTKGKKISIIDAKSGLVYYSVFDNGNIIEKQNIIKKEDLNTLFDKYQNFSIVGETSLIGKEEEKIDIVENMYQLSLITKGTKMITNVNPLYLK